MADEVALGEGRVSSAALVIAIAIAACGTKEPRPSDSVAGGGSAKASDSGSQAANENPNSPEASARVVSGDDSEKKIDVGALVGGGSKDDETSALPVSLDGLKNDAPVISTKPPSAGSDVTWIDAGSDSIPNFGFAKQNAQDSCSSKRRTNPVAWCSRRFGTKRRARRRSRPSSRA